MTTANARKGAETERMVAKYLRSVGWTQADRRLREGRTDDQGDIDGVPFTTIQVKYWAERRTQKWVDDTLRQRHTAGTPLCLLVVRIKHRAVEGWEAYMPLHQLRDYSKLDADEREAWTWVCVPLRAATILLAEAIGRQASPSPLSSRTTSTVSPGMTPAEYREWCSAPSTENESPPSPTT